MSNIVRLQPRLRIADTSEVETERQLRSFRDIEAGAAIAYLRTAADTVEHALAWDIDPAHPGIIRDAKAALFHLLTLAGCREAEKPLRDLLREV